MPNNIAMNSAPAEKQVKKPNFFTKRRDYNIWGVLVLALGSIIMIFPFVFAFSSSLANNAQDVYQMKWFQGWNWVNYKTVLVEAEMFRYIGNTLIITAINMIGVVLSNSFIAFGFARYEFKGNQAMFFAVLCTMFLPGTVMQVPLFVMFNAVGAIDTLIPLTMGSFFGAPGTIFMMRQCYKGIPGALYEAAMIDGAHPLYIWARIYVPLARGFIFTMCLSTFRGCWNDLFGPLIYITSDSKRTLSLALANFNTKYEASGDIPVLMAAAVIGMAPTIIIFCFVQKQFIAGMASAAIKG